MKNLMFVVVLLLVGIVGLGFYRGWFGLSTNNTDHTSSATITVNQDKIREDETRAKEKVQNLEQKAREKTGVQADKAREPVASPEATFWRCQSRAPPAIRPLSQTSFVKENFTMLQLAITFLVIALIAGFLGFAGVAALSWEGAKILFFIFLVLAILSFLGHGMRGRHWR